MWEQQALKTMMAKGLQMSPKPSEADQTAWQKAGIAVWPEYEAMDEHCKRLIAVQAEFMKKISK
jgi:hypothetical protein